MTEPMPASVRPFPPCAGVEHQFVQAGGLRQHVATAGPADGPVVVLLHGWPQHWWLWREVIPALAEAGMRVLAPDLRGCGWTEATHGGYDKDQFASDVLALLDALEVDEFHLVGHDWGGWTGQLIALRAPSRVRRLTLLNIPHVWLRPSGAARRIRNFAYQPLMATPLLGPAVQRGRPMWRAMAGIPADACAEFRGAMREPGRARAGSHIYRTFLFREVLPVLRGRYDDERLTMPVRVLFGLEDVAIERSMLDGFSDHADDVQITDVPGCGHFIVDERPELVVDFVLEAQNDVLNKPQPAAM